MGGGGRGKGRGGGRGRGRRGWKGRREGNGRGGERGEGGDGRFHEIISALIQFVSKTVKRSHLVEHTEEIFECCTLGKN